jgi:hypothetical protein
MKNVNRDLLVLMKDETLDQADIELEVKKLNYLLTTRETIETFCQVTDIIDVSRNKVVTNLKKIKALITQPELRPFVFLCNKN